MTEPLAFALAAFALLLAPGPTNTLLATSGAAAGFKRSLHLIGAMVTGYLVSTVVIALVVAPLVRTSTMLDIALRIGCGAYLLYAAWKLWQEGATSLASAEPVKFRRVLVATLLNPKSIVFAYVIVPYLTLTQLRDALPYLGALAVMGVLVGASWIGVGAAVRRGGGDAFNRQGYARRAGALVLCLFAVLVSGSAFSA